MSIPILDSTRSALLNQAFLARDADTCHAFDSICIGTLGFLGLSSVEHDRWCQAEETFDLLQTQYAAWLILTEDLPWASDVERGVPDKDWDEPTRELAEQINMTLDFLIALSFLRYWTPADRVALDRLASGAAQ